MERAILSAQNCRRVLSLECLCSKLIKPDTMGAIVIVAKTMFRLMEPWFSRPNGRMNMTGRGILIFVKSVIYVESILDLRQAILSFGTFGSSEIVGHDLVHNMFL